MQSIYQTKDLKNISIVADEVGWWITEFQKFYDVFAIRFDFAASYSRFRLNPN